ncbi:tRNA-binding protein [Oscillospiraceae bacterium OttesenSCG-928-F05]|nr:tRNA-binding protein [Oscillospiraceae bacterium OttesenSCG-928-F05]
MTGTIWINGGKSVETASVDAFTQLDIRVGEIVRAEVFPKARRPAYKLWVDFGGELGEKRSSAQITELYTPEVLIGRQVLAVVNFPPRQVADFISEVLVLGVYTEAGVVLIEPDRSVKKGAKLG